jgi:hypothetical protein
VPAGWTIQQITHCSATLACSDSLPNNSTAAAVGEADPTTAAQITRQVARTATATVATSATVATVKAKTQALTATAVATTATVAAVKVPYVPAGVGDQGIGQLVAAVAGGIGV